MKAVFPPMTELSSMGNVEVLTLRYKTAFDEYQDIVDKNAELSLMGDKPSQQAQQAEERAFDELDSARYALLDAASLAYPTIH
jgi:pentose-5-phosphate-3-epimerase